MRLPRWHFWLIDAPAFIVTVWYRMYVVILALVSIITVSGVIALLLRAWWTGQVGW